MNEDEPSDLTAALYARLTRQVRQQQERDSKSATSPRQSAMIEPMFPGEHVDSMLQRLKREATRNDTLFLLKRSLHFTPKGEAARRKASRARSRQRRKLEKPHGYGGW